MMTSSCCYLYNCLFVNCRQLLSNSTYSCMLKEWQSFVSSPATFCHLLLSFVGYFDVFPCFFLYLFISPCGCNLRLFIQTNNVASYPLLSSCGLKRPTCTTRCGCMREQLTTCSLRAGTRPTAPRYCDSSRKPPTRVSHLFFFFFFFFF